MIVGAAFGKIVDSLVDDIIMPIIGIFGKADFSNYFLALSRRDSDQPRRRAQAGRRARLRRFRHRVVHFLIVAAALFVVVKAINTMKRPAPAAPAVPPPPSAEVVLLTEIRDALVKR